MIPCSKCQAPAVIFVRYSGQHLCHSHFKVFFERRVAKEVRSTGKMKRGAKLALAVSGGKDSVVMLRMLHNLFHEKAGIDLHVIIANEGIRGYREEGIEVTRRECDDLGLPLEVTNFKDMFGYTIDETTELDPETIPCTYCGVFRRSALNRTAKDIGADKLGFGHNLNDTAGSILMNICRGDVKRLARLGPHERKQPGLVPRLIPLRMIPEEETALYTILENIKILDKECPYAYRAQRGQFVKLMAALEDSTPGTRHSIISSYESLKKTLLDNFPAIELHHCDNCGEPGIKKICKACELVEKLDRLN